MAWTNTKVAQYGIGNVTVQHWTLSADAATVEIPTGLANVLSAHLTIKSATTVTGHFMHINLTTAATAVYGQVAITGCTSGDDLYMMVVGN